MGKSSLNIKVNKTVTTRAVFTAHVTADDIRRAFNFPKTAEVTVTVPGGGDWSGSDLDIGSDIPHVTVSWETSKTEEE